MSGVQTVAVEEDADGMRLDRWVKKVSGLSQGGLKNFSVQGRSGLDGGRAKSNSADSRQSVRMPPLTTDAANAHADRVRERASKADKLMLEAAILHKDHHVLVIDKPAGLAVQGGSKTTRHLDGMLDALTLEAAERPRLVHRLDKDTSGVLVLARTAKAAKLLSETFRSKGARKVYWAIVTGVPRPAMGRINLGLHKRAGKGVRRSSRTKMANPPFLTIGLSNMPAVQLLGCPQSRLRAELINSGCIVPPWARRSWGMVNTAVKRRLSKAQARPHVSFIFVLEPFVFRIPVAAY